MIHQYGLTDPDQFAYFSLGLTVYADTAFVHELRDLDPGADLISDHVDREAAIARRLREGGDRPAATSYSWLVDRLAHYHGDDLVKAARLARAHHYRGGYGAKYDRLRREYVRYLDALLDRFPAAERRTILDRLAEERPELTAIESIRLMRRQLGDLGRPTVQPAADPARYEVPDEPSDGAGQRLRRVLKRHGNGRFAQDPEARNAPDVPASYVTDETGREVRTTVVIGPVEPEHRELAGIAERYRQINADTVPDGATWTSLKVAERRLLGSAGIDPSYDGVRLNVGVARLKPSDLTSDNLGKTLRYLRRVGAPRAAVTMLKDQAEQVVRLRKERAQLAERLGMVAARHFGRTSGLGEMLTGADHEKPGTSGTLDTTFYDPRRGVFSTVEAKGGAGRLGRSYCPDHNVNAEQGSTEYLRDKLQSDGELAARLGVDGVARVLKAIEAGRVHYYLVHAKPAASPNDPPAYTVKEFAIDPAKLNDSRQPLRFGRGTGRDRDGR
jgi:hypothetical protein